MSEPLAFGVFDHRTRRTPRSPEYVVLHVEQGQENLHIDGEYAIYRRTDGPNADVLEAIVRDLAGNEPAVSAEGMGQPYEVCGCCDATQEFRYMVEPGPLEHTDTCTYRRAVEWVAEHPAPEDET